jgi:hypothetical protein
LGIIEKEQLFYRQEGKIHLQRRATQLGKLERFQVLQVSFSHATKDDQY